MGIDLFKNFKNEIITDLIFSSQIQYFPKGSIIIK